MPSSETANPVDPHMQLVAALLLRDAVRGDPQFKAEALLSQLGFSARDAALLLGKSEAAVAKAMQRSKRGPK